METPPASGATPDPRRPLLRFVLRGLLFVVPIVAWQAVSLASYLGAVHFPYQALQRYQEAKLTPNDSIDTVLLGDSSLGNGIDAAQFSRETGTHAVSLALTGLYGYAGSYNMLARAERAYPRLRNVVIVNTPDMLSRQPSARGLLLTLGSAGRLADLDSRDLATVAGEAVRLLFSKEVTWHLVDRVRAGGPLKPAGLIAADYMRQSGKRATPKLKPLAPESVQPEKLRYLARLVQDADARGLRVLYAHGPLWEEQVLASGAYLDAAERAIVSTGVTFVPGVEPIPTDRLGDAADHIAPEDKAASTSRYAARLRRYLR